MGGLLANFYIHHSPASSVSDPAIDSAVRIPRTFLHAPIRKLAGQW